MLADLTIENLGVIPQSTLELSEGLTVLTGETGAGKTMVVTGLRLLCGGRADASRVRSGADKAVAEGRFLVDSLAEQDRESALAVLEDAGGAVDEAGEVIALRSVSAQGRSRAYLGGRSTPAATLAQFTEQLLTIHGQNDQLRLLNADRQREALDRFEPKIGPILREYTDAFRRWRKLSKEYEQKLRSRQELALESDRLQFAIDEIQAVDPQPGEDQELVSTIRKLEGLDALKEAASSALAAIDGAEVLGDFGGDTPGGASDAVGLAHSALIGVEESELASIAQRLDAVSSELSELSGELGRFLGGLPADSEQLEQLLQRQQDIKKLTRKYAPDIDGVLLWLAKAEQKLAQLDASPEALEALQREVEQAQSRMESLGARVSAARVSAAQHLGRLVSQELQGLAMPKARFEVRITEQTPQVHGYDAVEFLLAPNAALEAKPLATSASGGELSRVMLALEVILSTGSHGTTLVFDEVDAGVGGKAAVEIGRRLAKLAQHHQVIVVTHLPQVAAYADTHLHVAKDVGETSVTSGVSNLDAQQRTEELSRMLAGLDDTETGKAHARELLERAQREVEAMRG
ncbi:DNA repair protein RecN [Corynebacterium gerontici]|uniref:DNA repair protein RecN n=1 Tax=Corynebacterium gerontici TaxID=2079234 RepID=A0A3G6J0A9_9CORY|nr:DNA repair protein RecN [Corynebacterium gerontici]AZA11356.1 DNA repair protein RecN [Corynebacterium gerontici]